MKATRNYHPQGFVSVTSRSHRGNDAEGSWLPNNSQRSGSAESIESLDQIRTAIAPFRLCRETTQTLPYERLILFLPCM